MRRRRYLLTKDFCGRVADYILESVFFIDCKEPLPLFISRLCFMIDEEVEKVVAQELARRCGAGRN